MPGYHTGPASHLGYLTGARHSHLDSAGYSLDQKAASKGQALIADDVAEALLKEERWRQVLTSLSICLFARGVYTPEVSLSALASLGFDSNTERLEGLGRDTLHRKYAFKIREGFDFADLRLPHRIFETPSPAGQFDEDFIRQVIRLYAQKV